jgi:large subunit ribosomal protein L29
VSAETVELRSLTDEQLRNELEEAHQSLFNLRFQTSTRQLADVEQVGKAKRRIARIKTLLRERELLEELDRAEAAQDGNE